ncbi:MAG TPA: SPOR domain-containing protein [Thermoanaerobaculia bacterium]|nr:SPOR domain-containing protein [Thermoanaerobaculia bacterium]HUM31128.1 SPOR domain-containing protein [Thermoanaerobaculia bacterium]HXK69473.1 SPOR domain-containing protein [Thermoanaerobaculia bacterium]
MSRYYEVTLSARHLWIILFSALGIVFLSFLLGLWVGSFGNEISGQEPVIEAEAKGEAEMVTTPDTIEPVDLERAEVPAFQEEPDKGGEPPVPAQEPVASAQASSPPEPVPSAPEPSASAGRWTVQVMAISNATKAQTWLQKLLASGFDVYMETLSYPQNKKLYRIRVGHFETREQADAVQRNLAKEPSIVAEKLKPWVTRL